MSHRPYAYDQADFFFFIARKCSDTRQSSSYQGQSSALNTLCNTSHHCHFLTPTFPTFQTSQYVGWDDFHVDMLLIQENCRRYNPPGHEIRRDCDEVFTFYVAEYERCKDKWQKVTTVNLYYIMNMRVSILCQVFTQITFSRPGRLHMF